ncbi:hypothetical protein [Plantibacter sp. LMC-P-059a]|uniref:hypothetical protein n=1 Tax=Plantibacter sp. LMC-P-059a TaxID=3040297 RepID=UPI00254F68CF|nr:hypothetical protein [Plantibacter sp. LMC-P-059a]
MHEDPTIGMADAAGPEALVGDGAPATSRSRRLHPVAFGGVIAATIVVAAAWAVGASVSLAAATAPSVMLQPYLDALEDGHLEQAIAMDGTAAAAAELGYSVDLLTDERYALATDRPTAYRVGATTIENGVATVDVAYERGGGERQTTAFTLRARPSGFLWFSGWRIEPSSLPTITVPTVRFGSLDLSVAGERVGEVDETTVYVVGPGSYDLAVDSATGFFDFEVPGVDAVWGGRPTAFLYPTLTARGQEGATAAVRAYVDACVASTSYEPDGCSIAIDNAEGDEMTGVTWLLTRGPEFEFAEYSATEGFLVTTTRRGSADFLAAFTSASGEFGIVTAEDCEVWVDGSVSLSIDGTWTFVPYTW